MSMQVTKNGGQFTSKNRIWFRILVPKNCDCYENLQFMQTVNTLFHVIISLSFYIFGFTVFDICACTKKG